jgi:hypothetical protein
MRLMTSRIFRMTSSDGWEVEREMGKREGARTITYLHAHVFDRNITIYVIIYTYPQHPKNHQENKCTPRLRSSIHVHQQRHC